MNIGVQQTPVAQKVAYLRTLPAIRERCKRVHDLAKQGLLEYFDYHPEHEEDAVEFCVKIIEVCATEYPHCLKLTCFSLQA